MGSAALYTLRGVVSFVIVVYRIRSGKLVAPAPSSRFQSRAPSVVGGRSDLVMTEVNLSSSSPSSPSSSSSLASTYSKSSVCDGPITKDTTVTYKGKAASPGLASGARSDEIVKPVEFAGDANGPLPGIPSQPRLSARLSGMESNATLMSSPASNPHLLSERSNPSTNP